MNRNLDRRSQGPLSYRSHIDISVIANLVFKFSTPKDRAPASEFWTYTSRNSASTNVPPESSPRCFTHAVRRAISSLDYVQRRILGIETAFSLTCTSYRQPRVCVVDAPAMLQLPSVIPTSR